MTDTPMDTGFTAQPLPCARVESLASEWVDGALSPELRAAIESHLDGCDACADLVADFAAIASEARALPPLEPARDLWAGIAARIEAPVVALDARRVTSAPPRRWSRAVGVAAAAAALVVVTAGITWRLTIDSARREVAAAGTPAPSATAPATPQVAVQLPIADSSAPTVASVANAPRTPRGSDGTRQAPRPAPRELQSSTALNVALPRAARAYDREIEAMRSVVAARRESLDPVTVRVLERNLKIIDEAIAESRAALLQDPASGLLADQLTRSMRRKLDLLRTAADLPARIS